MDTDTHGEHVAGMEHGANTAAPRTGYGHFSRPQRVGPVGAPRWRPTAAAAPVTNTAAEIKRKRPAGTPGLLVDRILVQTSAGAPLDAILALSLIHI